MRINTGVLFARPSPAPTRAVPDTYCNIIAQPITADLTIR